MRLSNVSTAPLRRIAFCVVISAATFAGIAVAPMPATSASSSSEILHASASSAATSEAAQVGQAAIAAAMAKLHESDAVMDVSAPSERLAQVRADEPFLDSLIARIVSPVEAQRDAAGSLRTAISEANAAIEAAKSVSVDSSSVQVPTFAGALPTPDEVAASNVSALRDATAALVAATDAEKERQAAARAAAASSAAAPRTQSGGTRSSQTSRSAPAAGSVSASINVVCTAPYDAGPMQATVDSCSPRGWIQMSYATAVPVIARHVNYGGSTILGLSQGDLVSVGGARYVVIGMAGISQDASQSAVDANAPGGAVLALQTCNWGGGPMRFVYLAPA